MKKSILLLMLVAMLSSCSTETFYYQVCKVSSDLPTSATGAYEYKNSACEISYDFWSDGGSISFIVKNQTDEFMYIDLSKSFLIKNGIAYDYFLNRTTYSQKTSAVAYEEQAIVAIPPSAAKIFSEYTVMNAHYADCDLYESPSKKEQVRKSFDTATSPVSFMNYICYRVGDNGSDAFIENKFYVSEVSNQHPDATLHKLNVGCPSDVYKTKERVFIRTSPKEFYVKYTPRMQKKIK